MGRLGYGDCSRYAPMLVPFGTLEPAAFDESSPHPSNPLERCWQVSCHDSNARRDLLEQRGGMLSNPLNRRAVRAPASCAATRFQFRGLRHFLEVRCSRVRGAVCMRAVVHVRALVTPRALHASQPGYWGGDGAGAGLRSSTCARCERCAFARNLTALLCCIQVHMEPF